MNEFVLHHDHPIQIINPRTQEDSRPWLLRTFPGKVTFQAAQDNLGNDYLYGINGHPLKREELEPVTGIKLWEFADRTCAISYLIEAGNQSARRFVSEPWEVRSATRELGLLVLPN